MNRNNFPLSAMALLGTSYMGTVYSIFSRKDYSIKLYAQGSDYQNEIIDRSELSN